MADSNESTPSENTNEILTNTEPSNDTPAVPTEENTVPNETTFDNTTNTTDTGLEYAPTAVVVSSSSSSSTTEATTDDYPPPSDTSLNDNQNNYEDIGNNYYNDNITNNNNIMDSLGEDDNDDEGIYAGNALLAAARTTAGITGTMNSMEETNAEDVLLSIPSFANAENRSLNEKLILRNQQLAAAQAETLEHQERVRVMQEHLKHVRIELVENQKLLESRTKELKTEDHLHQLAERAVGRMKTDIIALEREGEGLAEQVAGVQSSIYKNSEKLDKFKSDLNWKQEQLEKWVIQQRANDANVLALQEYTRADELRIKELTRELEQLTARAAQKRKELDTEVADTNARQVELDKCAEDFRAVHQERQDLIKRWQDSLDAIRSRDEEIAKAGTHFADVKAVATARRNAILEKEKRLANLESENTTLERTIDEVHRRVGDVRDELTSWTTRVSRLREEVEILKTEVSGASAELVRRRTENDNYQASIKEKERKVEQIQKEYEHTKVRLQESRNLAMSVEEAVSKKEEFLKREKYAVEKAEKELAALKDAEYRAKETVTQLHHEEELIMGQIASTKREIKNLSDKVAELDANSVKQQEHVYAAEFQIQQMERKIGRAKGEVSDEEKAKLEARIAELQKELDEARTTERSVLEESKKVKNALNAANRTVVDLGKQVTEVNARIDELLLQTRSGEEGLRKAVKEKEEAMVSHDLLKLEVRRLRDALSNKTDEVFNLENRAVQLEMTIEARKKEIENHRIVQRAAAKLAEEERHKLALDLADRNTRISTLKAKYETLCARLRGSEGDGEEKSQAYFVLQAAQKREELQREGDELDRLIQKAERETKALAHTLQYLNSRNDTLRSAFHQVDENSDDVTVVRALENQANDAQDALFKQKRQLNRIATEADEGQRQLNVLSDRIAGLTAQIAALENEASRVANERQTQLRTVEEVKNRLETIRQRHRRNRNRNNSANNPTPDEIAFMAFGLKDTNSSVLYTLGQLANVYPQMKPTLNALLNERGLRMPGRPPSRLPMSTSSSSSNIAPPLSAGPNAIAAITHGIVPSLSLPNNNNNKGSNNNTSSSQVPVSPLVVPNTKNSTNNNNNNNRRPLSAGSDNRTGTPTRNNNKNNAAPRPNNNNNTSTTNGNSNNNLGIMGRPVSNQSNLGMGITGNKAPSSATGRQR